MMEKYEEATGRYPSTEKDGDFVVALIEFEFAP
jgi:hypothetical protein